MVLANFRIWLVSSERTLSLSLAAGSCPYLLATNHDLFLRAVDENLSLARTFWSNGCERLADGQAKYYE